MKKEKNIMLLFYLVTIVIKGVLLVPSYLVYGSTLKEVEGLYYVPLWLLMEKKHLINGFKPIYEIDLFRVIYELGMLTLIFYILYLLLKNNKFDKEQQT